MKKYLVKFEFRYIDAPDYEDGGCSNSKTVTIGVFENQQDAFIAGNNALEFLEAKFALNRNWNRKQRLNKELCLISELGYLETPFSFFISVNTLYFNNIETELTEVLQAVERYKIYKQENNN